MHVLTAAADASPCSAGEKVPADLVEVAVMRGAFGVKGWVKLTPHDPAADVLRSSALWWCGTASTGWESQHVEQVRPHGQHLVAKWAGCDSPEQAEGFKGLAVAVSRSAFPALPAGQFYWVDLIGLKVVNRQDIELGSVASVMNNGVQDLLEVVDHDGRATRAPGAGQGKQAKRLIPLIPQYLDAVDLKEGVIRVDWSVDW
jgi:16S rRNA processing protein RimM